MPKILFIILCVGIMFLQTSFAVEHIGRVLRVHGEVVVLNKSSVNKKVGITKGAKIFAGDQLKSKSGSFVKILMADDTVFQLGPDSHFVFEKFIMKTKNDRVATYNLIKGKLRSIFTKKAPTRSLTIKTPSVSMGIRGTEILSDVYKLDGKLQTDIALIRGKLEIQHGKNSKSKNFFLKPGFIFESNKNLMQRDIASAPSNVRALPRHIFETLKRAGKKGGQVFLFDAMKKERSREGEVEGTFKFKTSHKVSRSSTDKMIEKDRSVKIKNKINVDLKFNKETVLTKKYQLIKSSQTDSKRQRAPSSVGTNKKSKEYKKIKAAINIERLGIPMRGLASSKGKAIGSIGGNKLSDKIRRSVKRKLRNAKKNLYKYEKESAGSDNTPGGSGAD